MPANINSNNSVTEKVWTMVTYTCSNGNVFKIYLNNTLVGANSTSTCARWGTTMRIGTEATANRNLGGNMDNLMIFNKSLNQTELDDLYNSGFGIMWNKTGGTVPASINVTLQLPTPYFNSSSQNILFNCSAYELNGLPMINLTLIIDNIDNYTLFNTTVNQNLSIETTQPVTANVQHNYTCRGSTASNSSTASPLKYFTVDTASPVVSLSNVTNIITDKLPKNSSWWFNATDLTLQSCWYYTNENLTNKTVPCNAMKINYSWATEGTKTFYACANDSFSRITCNSSSMEVIYSNYTQTVSLDPATEGSILTFALRVNIAGMQSKWTGSNATLIFNNVAYAPTSTASFDNYTIFTKTISIPMGYGNETGKKYGWNWTYAIANATYTLINANTAVNYSTIYNITMGGCGTGKVEIINLTWKDEETTLVNNGSMELDLNLTNENLTWNYYHTWASNDSVSVCVNENLLNYTSFRIDFVIGYDNLSTYVREFYYLDNGTLDNSSWYNPYTDKTIDLFDLPTADSTTFLFEYTDENNQEVENIIVHTYRYYIGEGLFREVERSRQDNSGQTHVHLVEEDVIYYFMITQGGSILYTSDTYNAKCLATPCEISLSASAVTTNWSIIDNEGGKYRVSTNKASRTVTVAFDLESQSLVNATVWKFSNGTASYINATSLNATSGSLTLSIPYVYDNSTFFVSIFRNNQFVKSEWVDLTESAINYFGTFGAILGGLVVLAIVLMAVSEGAGLIVFSSLALIIIGIMKLVDLGWLAIISLICAGGIIVWKLVSRRNSKQ
jgi:hypothetical protein